MNTAQHTCKIFLHPTACTNRAVIVEIQRRTGMLVVISRRGVAKVVPARKGAA